MENKDLKNILNNLTNDNPGHDLEAYLRFNNYNSYNDIINIIRRVLSDKTTNTELVNFIAEIIVSVKNYPHPEIILLNYEKLFEKTESLNDLINILTQQNLFLKTLNKVFAFSNYLSELITHNPEYLHKHHILFFNEKEKTIDEYLKEALQLVDLNLPMKKQAALLSEYKHHEMLRIGLRDFSEEIPLEIFTREISNLSSAIIEAAYQYCLGLLIKMHGAPSISENNTGSLLPCRFSIIGMGKFGGGELNFSSDVDIIFAYEDEGKTVSPEIISGPKEPTGSSEKLRQISNHEFFSQLGTNISNLLTENTSTGKIFRVDLRLRPEGATGPMARSLESYTNYFYSNARPWEKLVYLKARPVAGDPVLGEKFIEIAKAFVFQNIDATALQKEIAHLKLRIDNEVIKSEQRESEVKRGSGGIREIEFIIYLYQILYSSSHQSIKTQNISSVFTYLKKTSIIGKDDLDILIDNYIYLRKLEHHLQMYENRQTHLIPGPGKELDNIAMRFGFSPERKKTAVEKFMNAHRERIMKVHDIFKKVFEITDEQDTAPESDIQILIDERSSQKDCYDILKRFRFKEPSIERCFKRLAFGTQEYYRSTEGQKFFERILPTLLEYSSQTPFPDQAIRNFDNFLESAKGIASYYSVIAENPGVLKLLLRIFGTSNYLSRILIAHPEYFDEIVDPGSIEIISYPTEDLKRFFNRLTSSPDKKSALAKLRKRRRLELLKIGVRDVLELYSAPDLSKQLTTLAEGCLTSVCQLLLCQYKEKYGSPLVSDNTKDCRYCIAGMGGFGSEEITYFSDLDVIFFYEGEGETNGKEKISNYNFFSSLSEELSSHFSEITPEDQLYKLDARLRPEGKNAPLVISAERLMEYYEHDAQTWELLAFLKFRLAAGDISFGNEIRNRINQIIASRIKDNIPFNEIKEMRTKIEKSKSLPSTAFADIKTGIGGLYDIEFIIHTIQLKYMNKHNEIIIQNSVSVLEKIKELNLIPPDKIDLIIEAMKYYRRMQSKIRLLFESHNNYLPLEEKLDSLNVAFAFTPSQNPRLLDNYRKFSTSIREIYLDIVNNKY